MAECCIIKLENSVKFNSDLFHILIQEGDVGMKKIEVLPRTKTGNWAGMVSVAFIFLFTSKVLFALPMVSFAIFGVGLVGFALGIVAVFVKKDHALFTYLSLLTGVFSTVWIVAEMMNPH